MSIKKMIKIKDSAMFQGGSPNNSHWYLKYRDRKGRVYYKQVTHLYYKDPKRFRQLEEGLLIKNKITSFETPQGVYKKRYKPISLKKSDVIDKRIVFVKQKK